MEEITMYYIALPTVHEREDPLEKAQKGAPYSVFAIDSAEIIGGIKVGKPPFYRMIGINYRIVGVNDDGCVFDPTFIVKKLQPDTPEFNKVKKWVGLAEIDPSDIKGTLRNLEGKLILNNPEAKCHVSEAEVIELLSA